MPHQCISTVSSAVSDQRWIQFVSMIKTRADFQLFTAHFKREKVCQAMYLNQLQDGLSLPVLE